MKSLRQPLGSFRKSRYQREMMPTQTAFAFTLVEILVVISIIGLLALVALPAINGIQESFNLTRAASLIQDNLQLARQKAITQNEPVTLNLCLTKDLNGQTNINMLLLTRIDRNGDTQILDQRIPLPNGFSISENATWSSLATGSTHAIALPSQGSIEAYPIRFTPSGKCTLDSSKEWFLTVYNHLKNADPDTNFITIALDPVTGRTFMYQP